MAAGMGPWCCFQLRSRVATETDLVEFFPSPKPAPGSHPQHPGGESSKPSGFTPPHSPHKHSRAPPGPECEPSHAALSFPRLPRNPHRIPWWDFSSHPHSLPSYPTPWQHPAAPSLAPHPQSSIRCSGSGGDHGNPSGRRERVWECEGRAGGLWRGMGGREVHSARCLQAEQPLPPSFPASKGCLSIIHPPSGELSHPNKNVTRNPQIHP